MKNKELLLAGAVALVAGCVSQPMTEQSQTMVDASSAIEVQSVAVVAQVEPVGSVAPVAEEAGPGSSLYREEPVMMDPVQCGQCHIDIYQQVKNDGQKHQFQCLDCHQQLHAYNPVRQNWTEIMPQCASCHTLPHGEKFAGCLDCHQNPHTPLAIPLANIEESCGTCHTGPNGQLEQYASQHTEQGCGTCHTEHGLIPSCMECHEPHLEDQKDATCLACHPVHMPLEITYDEGDQWNSTCGACHDGVYEPWSSTPSKHGGVNCGECHISHGLIPDCQTCHDEPHDDRLLKKFPNCLDCHLDVHDLPVGD